MPGEPRIVLWHLRASHYNEKVRWALDFKRLPHVRRAVLPGVHPLLARLISDDTTLPVLHVDGRRVSDSTAIIAELERRRPDPPLYPPPGPERERALVLEDFFDERLGPDVRRLLFHLLGSDPRLSGTVLAGPGDPFRTRLMSRTFAAARAGVVRYYGAGPEQAAGARAAVEAALDRVEAERAGRDHLVGERFTVADLTAAALLAPLVRPPEFTARAERFTPEAQALADELSGHPTFAWVRTVFARRRHPAS